MRRTLTLAAATLIATGVLAGPALAHHQHYIETPQGRWITLPCEPDGTAAADRHPLHERLHVGPAHGIRAVEVDHHGAGSCSTPRPTGPTALP